jgi:hypothetical protein
MLRRRRGEKIVLVDRSVVIIQDVERQREMAEWLPQVAVLPEAPATPGCVLERAVTPEFRN